MFCGGNKPKAVKERHLQNCTPFWHELYQFTLKYLWAAAILTNSFEVYLIALWPNELSNTLH